MEIVVEVITRGGKVLSLHKFNSERVSLGRAYNNDLILQEEHVCPYHAELVWNEDGQLILSDQRSVNGIQDQENNQWNETQEIQSGDVFVLGKNYLRVFRADHPVHPAKRINVFEDAARSLNRWYWALTAMLAFFFISLMGDYLETLTEVKWSAIIVKVLLITLGVSVLPLLVSVAARVFKKDVKFFSIFSFSFIVFSVWLLLDMIGSMLVFNWGQNVLVGFGNQVIEYGVFLVLVWGAIYLASNMTLKKISITSVIIVGLMFVVFQIDEFNDDTVKTSPSYYAKVLPQSFMISSPKPSDEFLEETKSLFESASKEAERRQQESAGDQ
jgi:hypothetical protein